MKKIFLSCVFLLYLLSVPAQTKQIAHKSHSGASNEFFSSDYTDNFGEPPEVIDSIIILKNNCIIEVFTYQFYGRDTFCDHPYFTKDYTEEQIRAMYPEKTKFVGFEHYKPGKHKKGSKKPASHYRKNRYQEPVEFEKSKKNSTHLLFILIALGAGATYIFKSKNKTNE